MKLHNTSNGIINFQGRLLEPNTKVYINQDIIKKYSILLYKYYEEKKAVVLGINNTPLTLKELMDVIDGKRIDKITEIKTENYLDIVKEVDEETNTQADAQASKVEPKVVEETNTQADAQASKVEPKVEPKVEEPAKKQTKKRNITK